MSLLETQERIGKYSTAASVIAKMVGIGFALAAGLTGLTAQAATIFNFTMSGAQEVPKTAPPSTAFGSGVVTLSTDQLTLDISMTCSGLTTPNSAGHIHCCAAANSNAAVRIDFAGAGFPTGVTSGSYSRTFTLASAVT